MDGQTPNAILSKYLGYNASNPLNISRIQNLPQISHKSVEDAALKAIETAIIESPIEEEAARTASLGFMGLYKVKKSADGAISVNKKHQVFIVKLIESKRYLAAMNELSSLRHHIGNLVGSASSGLAPDLDRSIILGIEYNSGFNGIKQRAQTISLIISFHFLLLQCTLHYISTNTKFLESDVDSFWNRSLLYGCARLFLSTSNFSAWLAQSDPENIMKYKRNLLKLVKGYYSVISRVNEKVNNHDLGFCVSCFRLKLLEYEGISESESRLKLIPDERYSEFLDDLTRDNPEALSMIIELKQGTKHIEEIVKSLSLFAQTLKEDHLTFLEHINGDLKPKLIQHDKFLLILTKLELSSSLVFHRLVRIILRIFDPTELKRSKLSKVHLHIFDKLTMFVKDLVSENINIHLAKHALDSLKVIFTHLNETKRLRNISNLYFNCGNKTRDKDMWIRSAEIEAHIHSLATSKESLGILRNKFQKVSAPLIGNKCYDDACYLISVYFDAIDPKREYNGNLSSRYGKFTEDKLLAMMLKSMQHLDDDSHICKKLDQLSEAYKLALFCRALEMIHFSVEIEYRSKVSNCLISNVTFQSEDLQGVAYYKYLTSCGSSEYFEDKSLNGNMHPVISCGVHLELSISNYESGMLLSRCIDQFNDFLKQPYGHFIDIENEVTRKLINFLKFSELNGLLITIIKKYLKTREGHNIDLEIFMRINLCETMIKMGIKEGFVEEMKKLVEKFKTHKINSVYSMAELSLVQLEFHICTNSPESAIPKFDKIVKLLKDKDEFSLKSERRLDMNDKFANLLLVSKLQILGSRLNISMNKSKSAFMNIKMAIKLLYSIIKKSASDITSQIHAYIKWETEALLNDAYKIIIQLLIKVGITRDIWFYTNEFKKLNNKSLAPLRKSFNYLSMIFTDVLLKHEEGFRTSFEELEKMRKHQIVTSNLTFINQFNYVGSLLDAQADLHLFEDILSRASDDENLENTSNLNSDVKFETWYVRSLLYKSSSYMEFKSLEYTDRMRILERIVSLKMDILEAKEVLNGTSIHSGISNSSSSFPCIVTEGNNDFKDFEIQTINSLVQCKDILLKQMNSSKIQYLHCHEILDFGKVLLECLFLLSSITIMKSNISLSNDLFYLHDVSRSLTFENERTFNSDQSLDIIPGPMDNSREVAPFNEKAGRFMKELNLHLSEKWMIVTIDIDSSDNLILSRFVKDAKPFYLRLSLSRFRNRNMGAHSCSYDDLIAKFKSIIRESNQSTKSATTSSIHTKDDRRQWWKLRFSLDLQLKEMLDDIERFWFGGFKSIFNENHNDLLFRQYKNDFYKVLQRHMPSRRGNTDFMQFDDNIVKLFFNMQPFSKEAIDDLISFILDSLRYHGEINDSSQFNLEKLRMSLEAIHNKYDVLKSKDNDMEHVFIVPSDPCSALPWESLEFMKKRSVSRVPSIQLLIDMMKQRQCESKDSLTVHGKSDMFYVINPGGDLIRTESKFKQLFQEVDEWKGIVGRRPDENTLLSALASKKLFVYLGHGGCEQYIKVSSLFKSCLLENRKLPPSLLIGCSSGSLQSNGLLPPSGNVFNWLTCGSLSILVNLWDVTDKDIDMFSFSFFAKWGLISTTDSCINISEATNNSRAACALRYLNGAAPVVYGLPFYLKV